MALWNQNARTVLQARYLKRDSEGKLLETEDGLLYRVAEAIAKAEPEIEQSKMTERFYKLLDSLVFLPNSPTLMNAGRDLGQLSGCFALPIEDDISAIFEAVKQSAIIHKSGGGTGFSFSKIRPSGSVVKSTSGVASGPISFMKVFNAATEVVKQGGKRRGANLGVLICTHPDIVKWINCKTTPGEFENFNISVSLTDDFINAAISGSEFGLIDPCKKTNGLMINATEVFDLICHNSWVSGEPGVLFIDTINKMNPCPQLGKIETTNPCGEVPLYSYESCNLGSVDLSKFVKDGDFQWNRLEKTLRLCVRFLDDVIDVNRYPKVRIENKTKLTRKIGLGVMGWADALIELNIKYDSPEALNMADKVMKFVKDMTHDESRRLAKERGPYEALVKGKPLMRNASLTTIAPTGTLSLIANCSSSIEPLFSKNYTKTVMDDVVLDLSKEYSHPEAIVTAHEVSPEAHVRMQAAFQAHVDNAVSKTINLPNEATEVDIKQAILLGYELGCKGMTLYRDGTRDAPLKKTEHGLSECENGKCDIF
jgi:ribonucleoside-diphosphate reductase alpha chain